MAAKKGTPRRRTKPKAKLRTQRRASDGTRVDERGLEPNQAAFVLEYVKAYPRRNATRACMRAYGSTNAKSASVRAAHLMANPAVRAAIEEEEFLLAREARLEAKDVLARLLRNLDRAETAGDLAEVRKNLELLGRYRPLSMWRDRIVHSGPDDGPIRVEHDLSALSVEQLRDLEALKAREQEILAAAAPERT